MGMHTTIINARFSQHVLLTRGPLKGQAKLRQASTWHLMFAERLYLAAPSHVADTVKYIVGHGKQIANAKSKHMLPAPTNRLYGAHNKTVLDLISVTIISVTRATDLQSHKLHSGWEPNCEQSTSASVNANTPAGAMGALRMSNCTKRPFMNELLTQNGYSTPLL